MSARPAWTWPARELGRALPILATAGGLQPRRGDEEAPPAPSGTAADARSHLDAIAAWQGLELEPFSAGFKDMEAALRRAGPALIRRPGDGGWWLLAGADRRRGQVRLLGVDGSEHRRPVAELAAELTEPMVGEMRPQTEALLRRAGVPEDGRDRAVEAMLEQRLGERVQDLGFLVRAAPGSDFLSRLRRAGVGGKLLTVVLGHALQYALWLAAWWVIGRAVLDGRASSAWTAAWALLLVAAVPLHVATARAMGLGSVRVAGELKRRLMHGALSLDRDATRAEGIGAAFGRVLEAEAVESLALHGGLRTLTALVELPFVLWVLSHAAAGGSLLWGAVLMLLGVVLGTARYVALLRIWTEKRLAATDRLVEKMAGHQTRRVQAPRRDLHRGEDLEMKDYLGASQRVDRMALALQLWPRLWLPVAFAALMPTVASGAVSAGGLALAVGGILLLGSVLGALTGGLSTLGRAWISWDKVSPLFAAGRSQGDPSSAFLGLPEPARQSPQRPQTVLAATDLSFRHAGRSRPVLDRVQLVIPAGERILLEGPSGGGKSTLASVLVGLRAPESGSLSLWGLDRASLGAERWRRRVVLVPQFHDNHIVTETLLFNLLLGLGRVAGPDDHRRAYAVCRELGLGELLARMPSGMQQIVGETGWRLSHGERSRIFLARALLQDADLLILDESFAALDPESLGAALDCARRRAKTLIVIAHP